MAGVDFETMVDELVGTIENYLSEADIDLYTRTSKDLVQRACASWFAGYLSEHHEYGKDMFQEARGICLELDTELCAELIRHHKDKGGK